MVFLTLFNVSLNLAIRSSWSEPNQLLVMFLLFVYSFVYSFSIFGCKEYNQSDFGVDHLLMSMCRIFSCVVGRGCLLWPMHSLGKTLLAFALLHSVLQGQSCLLLQVFLDFLLFPTFVSWLPYFSAPIMMFPGITSKINCLHSNPYLRICFSGDPN